MSRSRFASAGAGAVGGEVAATLPAREALVSVGFGLATETVLAPMSERRFEEPPPKLLMRLKKRLVRLPPCSSVEAIDAEPGWSSLAGVGPGLEALVRPRDLRRRECRER